MLRFPRWRVILVVVATIMAIWFSLPNFFSESQRAKLPGFMPKTGVSLGLDLRGGSYLLLEVDMKALQKERLEAVADDVRTTLNKAEPRIGFSGLGVKGDAVAFTLTDPSRAADATKFLNKELVRPVEAGSGRMTYVITSTPDGAYTLRMTPEMYRAEQTRAVQQSLEVVRKRIDALGTKETTVQRQGEGRITVQVPGESDPERIKNLIGQTAKLTFQMVDESISPQDAAAGLIPPMDELLPSDDPREGAVVVRKRAVVSGDDLTDAQPSFDQYGESVVSFRFNGRGARLFGEATQTNVGKRFAIVLDEKVLSAPVIREPILGGSGQISGSFTTDSANDLSVLLRAGALPAKLDTIEQRTIGAELGQDAIESGMKAGIIGTGLVVAFMILAYGMFGVLACLALVINVAMIIAAMSMVGATLSLPGIAGLILTIGMAVDANVLIYERMREEQFLGRGAAMAIEAGFSKALVTIIDSHLTQIGVALILFNFGHGPVRGFAWTLSIGVITSVFTATLVTQLFIAIWFRIVRPKKLPI